MSTQSVTASPNFSLMAAVLRRTCAKSCGRQCVAPAPTLASVLAGTLVICAATPACGDVGMPARWV